MHTLTPTHMSISIYLYNWIWYWWKDVYFLKISILFKYLTRTAWLWFSNTKIIYSKAKYFYVWSSASKVIGFSEESVRGNLHVLQLRVISGLVSGINRRRTLFQIKSPPSLQHVRNPCVLLHGRGSLILLSLPSSAFMRPLSFLLTYANNDREGVLFKCGGGLGAVGYGGRFLSFIALDFARCCFVYATRVASLRRG